MKYYIIIFCLLTIFTLSALGTLRVESIKELPATYTSLKERDSDGKWAPALIVKTELKGLGFSNVSRPTKHAASYENGKHEYTFYMNDSQRVIEITHADYEPLEVRLLADHNINVKAQRVYEMVLTNVPEKEFIIVNIVSEPSDAEKIIDGKNMGTGQSFELFIGKHTLKLTKNGFKNITQEVEVSKNNTLFNNLVLAEIEPVMITIKSEPNEADIYINNVNEGKTNKQLFKFPGEYSLRLVLDKYDTVEKTITVTESGRNSFNYTLQKNTSVLTISTTPSKCDIFINNEKITGSSKEISAGMYKLEVKKDGYYEQSRTVDVEKGKNKNENFNLERKTGKLQFVVEPMEAQVILKQGNIIKQNWTGSKFFSDMPVGCYEIVSVANGYEKSTKKAFVTKDSLTIIEISLVKEDSNNKIRINDNEVILSNQPPSETNIQYDYAFFTSDIISFNYSLMNKTNVRISVFNIKGQMVTTLVDNIREIGMYEVSWIGSGKVNKIVKSGIYFVRFSTDKYTQVFKIFIISSSTNESINLMISDICTTKDSDAIQIFLNKYDSIIDNYKNDGDLYKVLFIKGYLYAEILHNEVEAMKCFESIVKNYPKCELAESAQFMNDELKGRLDSIEKFGVE